MSYIIVVDDRRQTLVCKYSGEITVATRETAVKEGTLLATKTRYRRVLVDLREADLVFCNAAEEAGFAAMISENEVLRNCKTAYVVREDQHDNDFIMIRATAKHHKARQFTDIDAAYRWLAEK